MHGVQHYLFGDISAFCGCSDDEIAVKLQRFGRICGKLALEICFIGRVIGKQGRIAKAIRTVMRAGAGKINQKIMVEID